MRQMVYLEKTMRITVMDDEMRSKVEIIKEECMIRLQEVKDNAKDELLNLDLQMDLGIYERFQYVPSVCD